MEKKFVIKKLVESYEIQKSYDRQDYLGVVVQCRTYLESWLAEYISAILSLKSNNDADSRQLIQRQFDSMFKQIYWLKRAGHIGQFDYDNLNNIRVFCDKAIQKGDVFEIVDLEQLDKYIEATVYYCDKIKNETQYIFTHPKL